MNPAHLPVAIELFDQWRKNRGDRREPSQRPFSREWEKLLEDAGLLSGLDRSEAESEARALAKDGWLEIKTVRYRANLIARVQIPLELESRWMEAFGYQPPSDDEARQIQSFDWVPELEFLRAANTAVSFAELQQLNAFLRAGRPGQPVPIKERSLEIFGDEKRLDGLVGGALIREGRLTLERLGCYVVVEPLGWQRGPSNAGPVIVLENAATWDSYRRWNAEHGFFSAVIYGQGNCFAERVTFLHEIFRELGGPRPVFYFGDLDAAGLRIPSRASRKAVEAGLPRVKPHLPSYRWLLAKAGNKTPANEEDPARREDFDWLGELADEAWQALGANHRLAQENIGWEFLSRKDRD